MLQWLCLKLSIETVCIIWTFNFLREGNTSWFLFGCFKVSLISINKYCYVFQFCSFGKRISWFVSGYEFWWYALVFWGAGRRFCSHEKIWLCMTYERYIHCKFSWCFQSKCFICGIGKEYFDKVPHGFEKHVMNEHNFANYMWVQEPSEFIHHLLHPCSGTGNG